MILLLKSLKGRFTQKMKDRINKFITEHFLDGEGGLKNDESLFGSGIVDSLRLFELIAFIERSFRISVRMSEITLENFDSVDNIAKLVKKKLPRTGE
ncbi:MAG: acyl carrier protein [Candidatus Omnitrophica bacterium]|nr:acyl carrier protein [Candidatus Omnitrophota bacterium]